MKGEIALNGVSPFCYISYNTAAELSRKGRSDKNVSRLTFSDIKKPLPLIKQGDNFFA